VSAAEAVQKQAKKDSTPAEIRELQLRLLDLENKVSQLEKKGARLRPIDLISMSFFAAINSAIIVISILLLLFLRMKIL